MGILEARGLNLVMYEASDITVGLHGGPCNNVGIRSRAIWLFVKKRQDVIRLLSKLLIQGRFS